MTAEPDLLPLTLQGGSKFTFTRQEVRAIARDYARANVAHAIAPLQAEIEALRAEVDWWKSLHATAYDAFRTGAATERRLEARAERLAGALREAREYVVSELAAERDKFAGYEHCSNITSIEADLAKIDAALNRETTNG